MWFLGESKGRPSFWLCSNGGSDTLIIQKTFFFPIFFFFFIFYFYLIYTNPCVDGWLSIDHSRGAALLQTKPWPRSRSSTNGLAPGYPRTWGAWWARGQSPFWPCPTENLILEVKLNLLLLLHLNTIVCIRMWWLINFSSYYNQFPDDRKLLKLYILLFLMSSFIHLIKFKIIFSTGNMDELFKNKFEE